MESFDHITEAEVLDGDNKYQTPDGKYHRAVKVLLFFNFCFCDYYYRYESGLLL
jgi:hypothetical protein